MLQLKIKLGRLYEYLEPFIKELENISYGYKASKDHHHTGEDGLFQHSVDVANKMLDIFLENEDRYLPRFENEKTGAYQTRKEKFIFHLALTGLLHDIGKIAVYQVETAYYYVPFITSLKDVQDSFIREKGNININYINSTHLSGMVFGILLERAGRKYYESFLYDFQFITMMLEAIHLEHYKIMLNNPILHILRKADGMSVAEERNEPFVETQEAQETINVDLAGMYVDFFKQWTRVSTNFWFYTGDYFLVVNPALHKEKLIRQISEHIGQPVHEDKVIDELIEKGYTEERITQVNVKLPNGKIHPFSVIKLKADKVMSQQEIESRKLSKVELLTQNMEMET